MSFYGLQSTFSDTWITVLRPHLYTQKTVKEWEPSEVEKEDDNYTDKGLFKMTITLLTPIKISQSADYIDNPLSAIMWFSGCMLRLELCHGKELFNYSYTQDLVALRAKPQKPVLQGQKTKQS